MAQTMWLQMPTWVFHAFQSKAITAEEALEVAFFDMRMEYATPERETLYSPSLLLSLQKAKLSNVKAANSLPI